MLLFGKALSSIFGTKSALPDVRPDQTRFWITESGRWAGGLAKFSAVGALLLSVRSCDDL